MAHDLKAGDTITFDPFSTPLKKARPITGTLLSHVEAGTYINDENEPNPAIWVVRIKSDDPEASYNGWVIEIAAERLIGMLQ